MPERTISALTARAGLLAGVCWIVTGTVWLAAAPQNVNDAPGVTVQPPSAALIHRAPVMYPAEAMAKGIQGAVTIQARLGPDGTVVDASVVGGPDELRKAALESVLNWHFNRAAAGSTQQVVIDFALPAQTRTTWSRTGGTGTPAATQVELTGTAGLFVSQIPPHGSSVVRGIVVQELPEGAASELVSQIPVHAGDKITNDDLPKITAAVRAFDSHLVASIAPGGAEGGVTIRIHPRPTAAAVQVTSDATAPPDMMVSPDAPKAIRVGAAVQQANLVTQVEPVYPALAKQAGVQGVVRLSATIGPDGHVLNLHALSGPPLLVGAAVDAVKQWIYKPTLLNGNPVSVITTVDVNFTLSK